MIKDTITGKVKRSYRKWSSMQRRCYDPGHPAYSYYAGRGIEVCDRWRGKDGYANFVADLGEPPAGLTLGRIDNERGYSPDNCRWETWKQQAQNKRPRRKDPTSLGFRADAVGLPRYIVYTRVRVWEWTEDEALSYPVIHKGKMCGPNPDRLHRWPERIMGIM